MDTYREIRRLTQSFEDACEKYKDTLRERTSNRSSKELSRGNTRGTAIHRFQCNFAWIVHELEMSHYSTAPYHISKALELIDHINNIAANTNTQPNSE